MPGLTPRAASRCAATEVVDGGAVVVIGGFAEVGDSDVEVGGAVVFSGASVVVAGGFVVVGTVVVGPVVVEVPMSSAEATWTNENDDMTSARTATIIPKAAHRDTTPSPARRGKARLRMTNTFRSEHMIWAPFPGPSNSETGPLSSSGAWMRALVILRRPIAEPNSW